LPLHRLYWYAKSLSGGMKDVLENKADE
jgi:hypothetical protein